MNSAWTSKTWVSAWIVVSLFFGCSPSEQSEEVSSDQVVNGHASGADQDFAVSIDDKCSGALVAPNLVITAAHCFSKRSIAYRCIPNPTDSREFASDEFSLAQNVRFGSFAMHRGMEKATVRAEETWLPPMPIQGSANACERDIALVLLHEDARYADGSSIPVAEIDFSDPRPNEELSIVGFGLQYDSNGNFIDAGVPIDGGTKFARPRLFATRPFQFIPRDSDRSSLASEGWELSPAGFSDLISNGALGAAGDSGAPVIRRLMPSSDGTVAYRVLGIHSRPFERASLNFSPPQWTAQINAQPSIRIRDPRTGGAVIGGISSSVQSLRIWLEQKLEEAQTRREGF